MLVVLHFQYAAYAFVDVLLGDDALFHGFYHSIESLDEVFRSKHGVHSSLKSC